MQWQIYSYPPWKELGNHYHREIVIHPVHINWPYTILQHIFTNLKVTTMLGRVAHRIKVDNDNNKIKGRPSQKKLHLLHHSNNENCKYLIYLLMNVHNPVLKTWDIIETDNTIFLNSSIWVGYQLHRIKHFIPTHLMDSYQLISKMADLYLIPPIVQVLTTDSATMYPNTKKGHGIGIGTKLFIENQSDLLIDLPVDDIMTFMSSVLINNIFYFGKTWWKHNNISSMWTPILISQKHHVSWINFVGEFISYVFIFHFLLSAWLGSNTIIHVIWNSWCIEKWRVVCVCECVLFFKIVHLVYVPWSHFLVWIMSLVLLSCGWIITPLQ